MHDKQQPRELSDVPNDSEPESESESEMCVADIAKPRETKDG